MAIWQARSRRIAAAQAAINNRTGRGTGAAPAAPVTGAAAPASANRWFSTRAKNIALVIAGVVVFFVGVLNPTWSNPHPAAIGSWGRVHWLTLILLWCIGAALIWLNASERAAKTLQMVLAGTVAAVLIVFPLWGWTTSPSAPARAVAAQVEWHRLDLAPGEKSGGIEVGVGTRLAFDGDEGIVLHTVYADGNTCVTPREACPKKHVVNSFFLNEAATPGKVAYTFR